jgi:hypothetical protein
VKLGVRMAHSDSCAIHVSGHSGIEAFADADSGRVVSIVALCFVTITRLGQTAELTLCAVPATGR